MIPCQQANKTRKTYLKERECKRNSKKIDASNEVCNKRFAEM